MVLPLITLEGRVAAEPELRFSPNGVAVGRLRLVASSRKKNEAGEWVDDKTLWMDVTAFKKLAENVAESVAKGDLITVVGRLSTDEWVDKEGGKRSKTVCIADSIAVSLAFRTIPHGTMSRGNPTAPSAQPASESWTPAGQEDDPPF